MAVLALSPKLHAGIVTVTTDPASTYWTTINAQNITITNQCVPVSAYDAMGDGVTFTESDTHGSGSITEVNWTFANAEVEQSSDSPTTIRFLDSAEGVSSACTVGVTHLITNGISCAQDSNSVLTFPVNVIQPALSFNTASWSTDNSLIPSAQFNNGKAYPGNIYFETFSNDSNCVIPYEYDYTMTPDNSGADTNKMNIIEIDTNDNAVYYDSHTGLPYTKVMTPDAEGNYVTNIYTLDHQTFQTVNLGTSPPSPKAYGIDAPGIRAIHAAYESKMAHIANTSTYPTTYFSASSVVITMSLISYPTYNDATGEHLDPTTATTHTFIYTLQAGPNGTGPFSWSTTSY